VISYYCIVNMPGVPCREIAALNAADDAAARARMAHLARGWPGFETIGLYDGERAVSVLTNRQGAGADDSLALDQAA